MSVRGYRSCKRTDISIDPHLTALIGPNGAGKTNALNAIQLLTTTPKRRIGPQDRESASRRAKIEAKFRVLKKEVGYRSKLLLRPGENNTEIVRRLDQEWNLKEFGFSETWISHIAALRGVDESGLSREKPIAYETIRFLEDGEQVVGYYDRDTGQIIHTIKPNRTIERVIQSIEKCRADISYYSASRFTNPAICPTAFEVDEDGDLVSSYRAGESGHLKFLHDLYVLHKENPAAYEQFSGIVGKQGVQLVQKINWKTSKFSTVTSDVQSGGKVIQKRRKRTLIIPTVNVRGDELSFNQLSEGTFRALALLYYVMQDRSPILLIEEPEVCIHHGLLRSVMEIIREFALHKQIILSTHSDLVVDMLAPENLRIVRDLNARGTSVAEISKTMPARSLKALREYLQLSGTLGEYWRHSGFQ